jgi:hypothetical protein
MINNNEQSLKQYIDVHIRANAKKEITGSILNTALNGILEYAGNNNRNIIVQNAPTPPSITNRVAGSIWIQPLKGLWHVVDDSGMLASYMSPAGYVPEFTRPMECADFALNGLREACNAMGVPVNSIVRVIQTLKELGVGKLQELNGNGFVLYDMPGQRIALLNTLYQSFLSCADYLGSKVKTKVSQVYGRVAIETVLQEQPDLVQPGGFLETNAGKRIWGELFFILANGWYDFMQHPKAAEETYELSPDMGDRSAAASFMASCYDRMAAAIS